MKKCLIYLAVLSSHLAFAPLEANANINYFDRYKKSYSQAVEKPVNSGDYNLPLEIIIQIPTEEIPIIETIKSRKGKKVIYSSIPQNTNK